MKAAWTCDHATEPVAGRVTDTGLSVDTTLPAVSSHSTARVWSPIWACDLTSHFAVNGASLTTAISSPSTRKRSSTTPTSSLQSALSSTKPAASTGSGVTVNASSIGASSTHGSVVPELA